MASRILMLREVLVPAISDLLSLLSYTVKTRNQLGLTDASVMVEHIMMRVLNTLYGWQLEQLNRDNANFPVVDLADFKRRVAIQVTTEDRASKIKQTIYLADKHKLIDHYDKLVILFLLPKAPRNRSAPQSLGGCPTVHIWSIKDLLTGLPAEDDLDRLRRTLDVLEEELAIGRPAEASPSESPPPAPVLMAQLQEENGRLMTVGAGTCPSYWLDLWIGNAPDKTSRVTYEILDTGFEDNPWTVRRKAGVARDFLEQDMNSYGDVVIVAQGYSKQDPIWRAQSTLYDALLRSNSGKSRDKRLARALRQIRDN